MRLEFSTARLWVASEEEMGLQSAPKSEGFYSVLLHYMLYTSTWTYMELSNDIDNARG